MDAVSSAQLYRPVKAHSRMLKIVQVIIIERVEKKVSLNSRSAAATMVKPLIGFIIGAVVISVFREHVEI